MAIQDIRDITSFKWAQVTSVAPLAIRLDGDTAPLALIPDSLVDPLSLVVGDRVRVELSLRKVVIHGRSKGDPRVAELEELARIQAAWAIVSGPTSFAANFINNWSRQLSSDDDVFTTGPQGIILNEDGYYDIEGAQRGNGVSVPNGYVTVALSGDRLALENRTDGVFKHDHSPANNSYSHTGYLGFLPAGSVITMGPPDSGTSGYMYYAAQPYIGWLQARRLS